MADEVLTGEQLEKIVSQITRELERHWRSYGHYPYLIPADSPFCILCDEPELRKRMVVHDRFVRPDEPPPSRP